MQSEPGVQSGPDGGCRWCASDAVEFGWYPAVLARVLRGADRQTRLAATCRGTGDRPLLTRLVCRVCGDAADPSDVVLDVGSGFGGPASWLDGALRARVQGVEPSAQAVALSRSLFPEVEVLTGDAAHLPVASSSTPVVFLLGVLSLVPDTVAVLRELRRVVRRGGALALTDYVAPDRLTAATADLPDANHPDPAGSLITALATTGWTPCDVLLGEAAEDAAWQSLRSAVDDAVAGYVAGTPHGTADACPVALDGEREARGRMVTAMKDGDLRRLTLVAR